MEPSNGGHPDGKYPLIIYNMACKHSVTSPKYDNDLTFNLILDSNKT